MGAQRAKPQAAASKAATTIVLHSLGQETSASRHVPPTRLRVRALLLRGFSLSSSSLRVPELPSRRWRELACFGTPANERLASCSPYYVFCLGREVLGMGKGLLRGISRAFKGSELANTKRGHSLVQGLPFSMYTSRSLCLQIRSALVFVSEQRANI